MNDQPPQTTPASSLQADRATDAPVQGLEATGGPRAAGSTDQPTVAGDRNSAAGTDLLQFIGDYVVVKKLGEGGMGAVYLAEDTKLHRKAAIKTMKPALAVNQLDRDRFLREARAAAAVEHDNIVPIWGVGEAADGTPFIAMPFLQGEMLDDRLRREPVANLGLILKVAREVADGLSAAHARGLIHRDIKPGNIWLEGNLASKQLSEQIRRSKILDFGLARSVDKEDVQLTASGAILGTPAYMAPEQARGEKVDHRADLFSLGVMLYRMATGKMPFRGPNAMAVLIALTTETPPPVRTLTPHLPPELADLIDRLMSKDPAGRPRSAAEVSATVRQIVKDLQEKKAAAQAPRPAPVQLPALPDLSGSLPQPIPAPRDGEATAIDDSREPARAPKRKAGAKRSRVWAVGAVALLALVPLGWWLASTVLRVETPAGTLVVEIDDPDVEARVKNGKLVLVGADGKERYTLSPAAERDKKIDAGSYSIRVEGADGLALDTKEFTLKKGDKVTVRVTLDPKAVAKKPEPKKGATNLGPDPEREAAELFLPYAERLRLRLSSGQEVILSSKDKLPAEGFTVQAVQFDATEHPKGFPAKVVSAVVKLRDLEEMIGWTWRIQLPADELRRLADAPVAKSLRAFGFQVDLTPEVVKTLKRFPSLETVAFTATEAGDAELALLADLSPTVNGVMLLGLGQTAFGDAGIKAVTSRPWVNLTIEFARGGKRGMDQQFARAIAGMPSLKYLNLGGSQSRDEDLGELAKSRSVEQLLLYGNAVTDAGLAHLKKMTGLRHLVLLRNPVKEAGVKALAAARPDVSIFWDGGHIAPTAVADPDRKAAEYVLSIGGTVAVNHQDPYSPLKAAADLPKDPFRLTAVTLYKNELVTDEALAVFAGCENLTWLYLGGTKVTDAGLVHFKGCKGLTSLQLCETGITGAGLAHFAGCTKLAGLDLHGTKVTDTGLAPLKGFKELTLLRLDGIPATEAGLANLRECTKLAHVWIGPAPVGDAGLAHLKGCKDLVVLEIGFTQVSDASLEWFAGLEKLRTLGVPKTKVTEAGVKKLAAALPHCEIGWDGGTIEPKKK